MLGRPPGFALFPYTRSSDLYGAQRVPPLRFPNGASPARDPRSHGGKKDRKSTRLNSSHLGISYAVFFFKCSGAHRALPFFPTRALPIYTVHNVFRHFDFRMARAPREILDRMAVRISRSEIHLGEVGVAPQNLVWQADALDEFLPVKVRHQTHAGDRVLHGDVHCRLFLVLGADNFVSRGSLLSQPLE